MMKSLWLSYIFSAKNSNMFKVKFYQNWTFRLKLDLPSWYKYIAESAYFPTLSRLSVPTTVNVGLFMNDPEAAAHGKWYIFPLALHLTVAPKCLQYSHLWEIEAKTALSTPKKIRKCQNQKVGIFTWNRNTYWKLTEEFSQKNPKNRNFEFLEF